MDAIVNAGGSAPEKPAVLSLDCGDVPLPIGGGKGANLSRLVQAGFPVPDGFVISTAAYRQFFAENGLEEWTQEAARRARFDDPAALEETSRTIRDRFAAGVIPPGLREAISRAYDALTAPAVAVRSSATTEDLPELSFAGQHDTFLNVAGFEALLDAVVRCWSSLFTARAIGYRARNGVDDGEAALAVVVQAMVQSEAAGVLFTANPLTGKRTEVVIDASFGLGEGLVSGLLEPDHYVVDSNTGRVLGKRLGAKGVAIRGTPGGGTAAVAENAADRQALPDPAIEELAALGRRVATLFGAPQDVEWAWAGGALFLLQSRPITSLFPVPDGMSPRPLRVLFSLGAFQGVLDPLTPLGRDLFRNGAARVSASFGAPATPETQRVFRVAGERLFIDATAAVRHPHARRAIRNVLPAIEPGVARALEPLLEELPPSLKGGRPPLRAVAGAMPLVSRMLGNLAIVLVRPHAGRRRIQRRIEEAVEAFQERSSRATTLAVRLELCDGLVDSVRDFGPVVMPGLAAGLGALRLLQLLVAQVPGAEGRVLETTRGLPHNVTTEMDLALWEAAVAIRGDAASARRFREADGSTLAAEALEKRLPPAAEAALSGFLRRFGMRGVAEIDVGRPRWREEPRLLVQSLQSYLLIEEPVRAPDAVFARGAAAAEETIGALVGAARRARFGWLRALLVRAAARRLRALAGLRESPKFAVIRLLGILREALLASGRELAAAGTFARPDDLFFLELGELRALSNGEKRDWRTLVAGRRRAYEREKGRRQVPRLLLSDGRAFFEGAAALGGETAATLAGTPVSPGVVEGVVRVVFEPHEASLAPGEILVCKGTDPAWTPLFLAAGGLVMEVGGLMTHGSVVAREYGIPAVVGVAHATARLATGQRVRVDGSRGRVTLLETD